MNAGSSVPVSRGHCFHCDSVCHLWVTREEVLRGGRRRCVSPKAPGAGRGPGWSGSATRSPPPPPLPRPHSWAPSLVVMRPHPGASQPALMWLVYCPRNALVLREGSRGRKPRGCCHVGEGSSSRRGCGLGCSDASAPRDQTEQQMPLLWAHPTSASSWLLRWHPEEWLPVTSSHPLGTAVPAGKGGGPGSQAVVSSPRCALCIPWRKGTVSESPQSGRGPKEDCLAAELSPGAWGQSSARKVLLSGLREDPPANPGKITGQGSSSVSALLG